MRVVDVFDDIDELLSKNEGMFLVDAFNRVKVDKVKNGF
jgi:hypothetical protein